jgi:hypothetical protein
MIFSGAPTLNRVLQIAGLALVSLALATVIMMIAAFFQLSQARAQDRNRQVADVPIHEKFYSTAGVTSACLRRTKRLSKHGSVLLGARQRNLSGPFSSVSTRSSARTRASLRTKSATIGART